MTGWRDLAACAGQQELFFDGRREAKARAICARCPVRAQCLEYALSGAGTWRGIATGIWGGTTPQERDQPRQQRKAVAA